MTKLCQSKVCAACGQEYQPTGSYQKYCFECRRIVKTEQHRISSKIYREEHPEQSKINHSRYYATHKEEQSQWIATDKAAHPEKYVARAAAYYLEHKEEITVYRREHKGRARVASAEFYAEHREEMMQNIKQWRHDHPENVRVATTKCQCKRRKLGFIPINSRFIGSEGHHLDKEHVIYVPKILHKSVGHSIWTGLNMDSINDAVVQWYISP